MAANATTKDSTVVTAFKQTDTAEQIAVRDLATSAVPSISRREMKEVKLDGTVMPDSAPARIHEAQLGHFGGRCWVQGSEWIRI